MDVQVKKGDFVSVPVGSPLKRRVGEITDIIETGGPRILTVHVKLERGGWIDWKGSEEFVQFRFPAEEVPRD